MNPHTIFITRYVTSHDATVGWYERLFGRPADGCPVPSCQEWRLADTVLFQLIEAPDRQGDTTVSFRVRDLTVESARLREAGLGLPEPAPVEGFANLRFVEALDPDGVPIGLLDGE